MAEVRVLSPSDRDSGLFADEPSYEDDYVGQGDPESIGSPLALGPPRQLLVGVVPGIGLSTIHCIPALSGAGLPSWHSRRSDYGSAGSLW